ncbi:MAG TPA: AraC family transcriptional regulator [Gammaproteobacteria bacterium]
MKSSGSAGGHRPKVSRATWAAASAALLALSAALAGEEPQPEFAPDSGASQAAAAEQQAEFRTLDQEVQDLKKLVVDLNRDLFLLEEELLFPANTQVAVFVSMDVGEFFALDSVQLEIDGKEVADYLYTAREVDALVQGGVHRLYIGNVKAGEHELVAFFTGDGTHERDYRRGASLTFEKGIGPKYIELTISDRENKLQPEFLVKEWE